MKNCIVYNCIMLLSFYFISCGMQTKLLENKRTKVPFNKSVFPDVNSFDTSLLHSIDTAVIYEEFSTRYNVLARLDNHIDNSSYSVYRFYPNGRFNYFIIKRDSILTKRNFDPRYNGYRGFYIGGKGKIKGVLFAEINGLGYIGRLNKFFRVSGDTLIVTNDINNNQQIYLKRRLLQEYFGFKAQW